MSKKNKIIWGVFIAVSFVAFLVMYYFFHLKDVGEVDMAQRSPVEKKIPNDMDYYAEAVDDNKPELCEKIIEPSLKTTCQELLLEKTIYYDAIEKMDINRCSDIQNTLHRESCLGAVNGNIEFMKQEVELFGEAAYLALIDSAVFDLACGVTDFDSPYVKPVQCDPEKMKKGESLDLLFWGYIRDEAGNPLEGVRLIINRGESFYTDASGRYEASVIVDSIKKTMVLSADKLGFIPIRRVLNAQKLMDDGSIKIPSSFENTEIAMREIEVFDINLDTPLDEITIRSERYPGLTATIPTKSLVDSEGKTVRGEITGEIVFLDPEDPVDRIFTPGYEGTAREMVGVDANGQQVLIESSGMWFLHLKKKDSEEILQPSSGARIRITHAIPDRQYFFLTDPASIESVQITPEELKELEELHKSLGITEKTPEQEKFDILVKNDRIGINYWHFNERIGLWEEWPVRGFDIDIENGLYILDVTKVY